MGNTLQNRNKTENNKTCHSCCLEKYEIEKIKKDIPLNKIKAATLPP